MDAMKLSGKILNRVWNVNAKHALYRKTGDWYNLLNKFPGALFDQDGYLLFETKGDYDNFRSQHRGKKQIAISGGIASISGYKRIN